MADRRATNRAMFWRIIRRLFGANRGRLFVMLLALGAGAAVTAALLNLQVDAKRRLATEFRSLGANVIIAPRNTGSDGTIDESVLNRLPAHYAGGAILKDAFLYTVANLTAYDERANRLDPHRTSVAVIAGLRYSDGDLSPIIPYRVVGGNEMVIRDAETCQIGQRVASGLHLRVADTLQVKIGDREDNCVVSEIRSFGGPEDSQVFLPLSSIQHMTGLPHRISLVQASVSGTPAQIGSFIGDLQRNIPEAEVLPIRQFTEGEAKIYNRISGLLTATVGVVLVLTGLCVMAAMTNVAMERKNDVGLMKAIGGSVRRVLRLFLAEAALLGLAGGMIGAAAGIFLSIGLGKAVFGVAARPRLIVYPVAVALTIIVAILSAYPLRRLASIRPASVFRGEA
jgi:putative ABC transport system permease protein